MSVSLFRLYFKKLMTDRIARDNAFLSKERQRLLERQRCFVNKSRQLPVGKSWPPIRIHNKRRHAHYRRHQQHRPRNISACTNDNVWAKLANDAASFHKTSRKNGKAFYFSGQPDIF